MPRIPAFFLIILFFSFCAHLFLYFSVITFFSIAGPRARLVLLVIAIALSFTFFASIILVRSYENIFTQVFYVLSALWAGLLINLLMAMAIGWVIFLFSRLTGHGLIMHTAGKLLFAAAFLFSAWGVWNAAHPRVKEIELQLPGIPPAWRGRTMVQLSDVHLGVINRAGFMRRVAHMVDSLHPDVIFITGDLFDGMAAGLDSFIGPLNELKAEKGVYFVTGNHETFLGLDRVYSVLDKTNIKTLNNDVLRIDGLQIIGVSYPVPGKTRDVEAVIRSRREFEEGLPGILLYHMPASINSVSKNISEQRERTYFSPLVDFSAAKDLGAVLQLSGHTHKGQMFPFNYLTRRVYRGYDYGLHSEGRFSIYTTCGTGTWGPPMRTGNTPEIVAIRLR